MPEILIQTRGPAADPGPRLKVYVLCGIAVVLTLFGGLIAWSALAPLESAAVAPGSVSVEFDRKTIKHLEGGIVRRILVAEGERVKAGQTLFELDETQARAQLELYEGRYATAATRYARLDAERRGDASIALPDWIIQRRGDPRIEEIVARQTNVFEARKDAIASKTAILTRRIAQLDEEIKGLKGESAATRSGLAILDDEISVVSTLLKKGLARKPRLLELKRRKAELEGQLSRAMSGVSRAEQRIGETRLQITDLHAEQNADVTKELREVQSQILDLGEQIRVAKDVVKRSRIVAPLDGTVVGLQVHTVGGVIGPGEALAYIVPSEDRLIVEARIDPTDIDVVRAGMTARIVLTPFNSRHSSSVAGKVRSVSADSLSDEHTGKTYYLARIELADIHHGPGQRLSLYPGMPARVMVITGKHSFLEYLIKPITRDFSMAFREE